MEQINRLMRKPLSNYDILDALNNKCNLVLYSDIQKYNSIDSLLGKYGICVVLYNDKAEVGHWILLLHNRSTDYVELFDSYADNYSVKEEFKKRHNDLFEKIYKGGYNLLYNDSNLQKLSDNVNTCGRWVIVRALERNKHIDTFVKDIKESAKDQKISPDQYVTYLTQKYPCK